MNCANCEQPLSIPFRDKVVVRCRHCNQLSPTGLEGEIRETWERREERDYPLQTAARAMAYCNRIYDEANKGIAIRTEKVERQLGDHGGTIVAHESIKGRSHGGYTDSTTVCVLIGVEDPSGRTTIYVVFRGSVGFRSVGNPNHSGRADGNLGVNVDWRANFDNQMTDCAYASGADIRVHHGFDEILGTYRERVAATLNQLRVSHRAERTIISGHSQGAAHAILFAHWLSYQEPTRRNFVIPFAPPRVGNFEFARDFTRRVTDHEVELPGDGHFTKSCFLMVQDNDQVPKGQTKAYADPDRRGVFGGNRRKLYADQSSILFKGIYALSKDRFWYDPTQVYFHPQLLTIGAKHGYHKPDKFAASMMKRAQRGHR